MPGSRAGFTMLRHAAPHGLVRLADWRRRFLDIGQPPSRALGSAASPSARQALLGSRFEFLPYRHGDRLDLVVDVGANEGQWSRALRRFVTVREHHLFEPNPAAAAALGPGLAGRPGVHVHRVALGAEPGRAVLNVPRGSSLASLLEPRSEQTGWHREGAEVRERLEVPVTRLDDVDLGAGEISLLKLDAQGFERRVLDGGRAALGRTRCVLVELDFLSHYHGDSVYFELARDLEQEFGFALWDLAPVERMNDGRALWTDAVYVSPAAGRPSAVSG